MDIEKKYKNKSKYFLDNKIQNLNSILSFLLNDFLLNNKSIFNKIIETIDLIETVKLTKQNKIISKHFFGDWYTLNWRIYISKDCVYIDPLIFNDYLSYLNKLSLTEQFQEIENTYKQNKIPVKLEHEIFISILCELYKELTIDLSTDYLYGLLKPCTLNEIKIINNIIENPKNAITWAKVYQLQQKLSSYVND